MVIAVSFTTSCPSLRQYLVVAPWKIKPRMNINQEPDKHWYEERTSKHMRSDNVQREVGQQDQTKSLKDIELVCNLWVDLRVIVVQCVDSLEEWKFV